MCTPPTQGHDKNIKQIEMFDLNNGMFLLFLHSTHITNTALMLLVMW